MKTLLLAFIVFSNNNTETVVHEVPSEVACDAYAMQIGQFRGFSVTKLVEGKNADFFVSLNQKSLHYKCVPLDDAGVPTNRKQAYFPGEVPRD